jgi:hypothetical protein
MDQTQLAQFDGQAYFTARLSMITAAASGRLTAFSDGYRPNFWTSGNFSDRRTALGATIIIVDHDSLAPGESSAVLLFPFSPESWQGVLPGAVVHVSEGQRLVGTATIVSGMSAFDSGAFRDAM